MTLIISIIAIIISISSFSFNLYQYRKTRSINLLSKTNDVLKQAYTLLKSIHDLRHKVDTTDDIESYEEQFEKLEFLIGNQLEPIVNSKEITLELIYVIEQKFIGLELEFSLFSKQINALIEFNQEVKELKA